MQPPRQKGWAHINLARLSRKLVQREKLRVQKVNARWRILYRGLMTKNNSGRLFAKCRLRALVNKYVRHVQRLKHLKAAIRLRLLARKLLMKRKSQAACFNLSRLARKYVQLHEKRRQLVIIGRWKRLIGGLVGRHVQGQTTVHERWMNLISKIIPIMRKDRVECGWNLGTQVMKAGLLDRKRKGRALEILARWSRLIKGITKL